MKRFEIEAIRPRAVLVIDTGSKIFYAHFETNPAAQAFIERLNSGALSVEMNDFGGFEKVGDLPWALLSSDERITAKPGDLMLYQGNKICLYYGENNGEFTRLATVGNVTKEDLLTEFGEGGVTLSFSLEWSE